MERRWKRSLPRSAFFTAAPPAVLRCRDHFQDRIPVPGDDRRLFRIVGPVATEPFFRSPVRAVPFGNRHARGFSGTADMSDQFISVCTLEDRFEGDILMDALSQESIPAILRPFQETPYSALFVPQKGWGLILVPENMAPRAREVIDEVLREVRSAPVYSDPSDVDPLLWERLREADPETVCHNALVEYEDEHRAYVVPFLNAELLITPGEETTEVLDSPPYPRVDFELNLSLLHYLLEAENVALTRKWIGEKDIPSGEAFFRGLHRLPVDSLIELFGPDARLFRATAELLGGTPVDLGDAAYEFQVLPRVPLLVVLWEGDEEFEPALHILFDETVSTQFKALDTLWAFTGVFCRTLAAAARDLLPGEER
ncbi:hypothetical protein Sfum_1719 [Syntrophobacter fumaroxidans MPOB]|uniref:DUF3786 domain-containing protein n=2 Tax=Syntrophobacter TaxID=29526 RepID=A0LJ04_SYNFM|nr:hypothetical protein Sfum_1719 [Syntrophobacter fumaroxidans MPOB]